MVVKIVMHKWTSQEYSNSIDVIFWKKWTIVYCNIEVLFLQDLVPFFDPYCLMVDYPSELLATKRLGIFDQFALFDRQKLSYFDPNKNKHWATFFRKLILLLKFANKHDESAVSTHTYNQRKKYETETWLFSPYWAVPVCMLRWNFPNFRQQLQ